jgi:hypothetical protein
MGENKKKKSRRSYLNDFSRDLSGQYVYSGEYYRYCGGKNYLRVMFCLVLLGFLASAAVIVGGCTYDGLNNSFYCIIPYVMLVGALGFSLYAEIRMLIGGDTLREYIFNASYSHLKVRLTLTAVFSALSLLSAIVFLFLDVGTVMAWNKIAYPLLCVCVLVFALISRKIVVGMEWEKLTGNGKTAEMTDRNRL